MGRGKKPEVSRYERSRWLEEFDSGKGITRITKESGHDIRVVKRNIEIAREERQLYQARREYILKRLEQHQEDLLIELRRLHQLVTHFPTVTLVPQGSLQLKIYNGLGEHIKRLPVNHLLIMWEEFVIRYAKFKDIVSNDLSRKEASLLANMSGGITFYPWTPVITDVLEGRLSLSHSGCNYSVNKQTDGTLAISWGANLLTRSTIRENQQALIIEAHKKLLSFAEEFSYEFQEYRHRFTELSEQIIDELDVFEIKRLVAGRCRYCPA